MKNFLAALSDSICSLFIVNSNVASISLGNESFSTDDDLEYGYLINTGNHYDVYLPPELFAQAYELKNKEMNAQIDFLTRYAIYWQRHMLKTIVISLTLLLLVTIVSVLVTPQIFCLATGVIISGVREAGS